MAGTLTQWKRFHLLTSRWEGINHDTAEKLCRDNGMELAQIESDEERAALNVFNMKVPKSIKGDTHAYPKDLKVDSHAAWVAGHVPKEGSRTWVGTSSWLQDKVDNGFCKEGLDGCCHENGDDRVCAYVVFNGKDENVEDSVTGCAKSERRLNVVDDGCGLAWLRAAICQSISTSKTYSPATTSTAATTMPTTTAQCTQSKCRSKDGSGGYDCWANIGVDPGLCDSGYYYQATGKTTWWNYIPFAEYTCCDPNWAPLDTSE